MGHTLHDHRHCDWDRDRAPALVVAPGEAVFLETLDASGGLFSAGDGHAAQGDGEVCGTAIETGMQVSVELELINAAAPRAPVIETPAEPRPAAAQPRLVTTGVGPDLMEASRTAVRQMVDELGARRGLSAEAAYLMCSVCGDLSIAEIVDAPNWTVASAFPLGRLD